MKLVPVAMGSAARTEDAMAVYVNQLRGQGRFLLGRTTAPPPLFALTADAEDELHAFAARLGLRRDPGAADGARSTPPSTTR